MYTVTLPQNRDTGRFVVVATCDTYQNALARAKRHVDGRNGAQVYVFGNESQWLARVGYVFGRHYTGHCIEFATLPSFPY